MKFGYIGIDYKHADQDIRDSTCGSGTAVCF